MRRAMLLCRTCTALLIFVVLGLAGAFASDGSFNSMPITPALAGQTLRGTCVSGDGGTICGVYCPPSSPIGCFKWTVGSTPVILPGLGVGDGCVP